MIRHIFLYTITIVIVAIIWSLQFYWIFSLGNDIFISCAIVSVIATLSTLVGLYFYHGNKWWITALSIISASFYALLLFQVVAFFIMFSGFYVLWLVVSVPSAFIGSYVADRIEKDSVADDDEA